VDESNLNLEPTIHPQIYPDYTDEDKGTPTLKLRPPTSGSISTLPIVSALVEFARVDRHRFNHTDLTAAWASTCKAVANRRRKWVWTSAFLPCSEKNDLRMPKILVVEDNLDTREFIHLHLITEGFNVVLAANGQEGLYLASVEQPNLIITDIEMPILDGIEMVKKLRAQPDTQNVPILVLTAFGKEVIDNSIRAGANRAMAKPVLLDELMNDVRELLSSER
jgi:CheY-like chemotaxis protein